MSEKTVKKETDEKTGIDPQEMVTVKLHMDKQHMAPLHVMLNNYIADIPRGVDFPVPYYVAKHIEEMEKQDNNTLLLTMSLVEAFNKKAAELG